MGVSKKQCRGSGKNSGDYERQWEKQWSVSKKQWRGGNTVESGEWRETVERGEETVESGECERQWRVRKAVESARGSGECERQWLVASGRGE